MHWTSNYLIHELGHLVDERFQAILITGRVSYRASPMTTEIAADEAHVAGHERYDMENKFCMPYNAWLENHDVGVILVPRIGVIIDLVIVGLAIEQSNRWHRV